MTNQPMRQPGKEDVVTLYAVGDVGPNREDPESLFSPAAPVLRQADILFGQLEIQLSEKGTLPVDARHGIIGPILRAHPRNVAALTSVGFNVISFTANHGLDLGADAFLDTIDILRQNNILVIGAGKDLAEARRPAIIERKGTRFGFLAYCSVVGTGRAAGIDTPGLAPMRASTFYEQFDYQPGTPPRIITIPNHEDLEALEKDIRNLRPLVDLVIVSMHWGVHFVPAVIPMYEWEVGHAAIDAGADLIVGGHPHILNGIEVYKGKLIFHSLGNFAFDVSTEAIPKGARARIRELSKIFPKFLTIDPDYPTYPFHPDSRKTIVVKCKIVNKQIQRISLLPALINKQGQPEILSHGSTGFTEVLDYIRESCEKEDLGTKFEIEGDEVLICR